MSVARFIARIGNGVVMQRSGASSTSECRDVGWLSASPTMSAVRERRPAKPGGPLMFG